MLSTIDRDLTNFVLKALIVSSAIVSGIVWKNNSVINLKIIKHLKRVAWLRVISEAIASEIF